MYQLRKGPMKNKKLLRTWCPQN